MLSSLIVGSPWLGALLCAAAYAADYYLTLWGAALYQRVGENHLEVEGGFPGSAEHQATLGRGRLASRRMLLGLTGVCAAMVLANVATIGQLGRPELYQAIFGGVFVSSLLGAAEALRLALLVRWASARRANSRLTLTRRDRISGYFQRLFAIALLAGLAFLVSGNWFWAGAGLACVVAGNGLMHWVVTRT